MNPEMIIDQFQMCNFLLLVIVILLAVIGIELAYIWPINKRPGVSMQDFCKHLQDCTREELKNEKNELCDGRR